MNLKRYLRSIEKTFGLFADKTVNESEAERLGASELFWATKKASGFNNVRIKKGDIVQFDFGKNLEPEMSYEHRGLVIGMSGQLLYVLPIFSYRENKHRKLLYDPITARKENLFLLKSERFNFIKHDSVLKLNDMRTISTKRILYKQNGGRIDPHSEIYQEIEMLVLFKYFPEIAYRLNNE